MRRPPDAASLTVRHIGRGLGVDREVNRATSRPGAERTHGPGVAVAASVGARGKEMAIFGQRITVPLAGSVPDALGSVGSVFKRVRKDTMVKIGLAGDFTAAVGDLTARITIGANVITENYSIPSESALNMGVEPDKHVRIMGGARAGEEIIITLNNGNAAAMDVDVYVAYPD